MLSLGCLLKGLNAVPGITTENIDNKAVEYEQIDGITPLMGDDQQIGNASILPENQKHCVNGMIKSLINRRQY